ncbi:hypothetical protein HAX54_008919 [Datura stramonium]|uniref:Myb/SANT-like domain-containing protein n=1 Tax=Datura stramonium TaxID=4076 RepID=A0ABS8TF26_DATST|nr:hypothetical protein [Datura stramonium]
MEYLMLEILAYEVKQGDKSTNQFKVISFNRVSDAIKLQPEIDYSPKHVENHLKTLQNTWNIVQTLLNKSILGWNDNLKVITVSPRVYTLHILVHSSHNKFINKYIDMFEEISLVRRNDRARSDCAKPFDDISLDCSSKKGNDNDIKGQSKGKDVVNQTSQVKASRKINCSSDVQDVVSDISKKLGEVAAKICRIADSRLDVTKLYEENIVIEGYEKDFLGEAFDYLVQSDTLAKALMSKSPNLRKVWLKRFKRKQ